MKRYTLLGALTSLVLILTACGGSQGAIPDTSGELSIIQLDSEEGMNFSPDTIILTAGQRVRIIIENQGAKNHEFMIGRNVVYTEAGAPDGFEEDFFATIADQVKAEPAMGAMVMMNGEIVSGMDMGMGDSEMGDHMGWMLVSPTGTDQRLSSLPCLRALWASGRWAVSRITVRTMTTACAASWWSCNRNLPR